MRGKDGDGRSAGPDLPLAGHLSELRRRILFGLGIFVAASFASFALAERIAEVLLGPAKGINLVYLAPSELFMVYVRLSFWCGLVISLPVLIYEVWAFVTPALKRGQRLGLVAGLGGGAVFFGLGAAFAFLVVVPTTIRFFLSYSMPNATAMISIESYFGFVSDIVLAFGVAFELPLACLILGAFGLLSHQTLRQGRKFAVLGIFILAAILSPPDVVSQILLALPMLGLYELSILALRISSRRRRNDGAVDAIVA